MDEALAKKFGRKKQLKSTVVPIYPKSAEREIQRVVNAYMTEVIKALKPMIYESLGIRADAFGLDPRQLDKLAENVGVEARLRKIARQVENQSFREWNRCVRETLGVNLPESYYVGALYAPDVNKWLLNMTQIFKELPNTTQQSVQREINRSVKKNKSATELLKAVNQKLAAQKRLAKVRTVAEVPALFGTLNRLQQTDAGCSKYYWKTARDSRVRPCHRALDGRIFEWWNPPAMWRETKHGIVYTGMRCNPGEDYGCRCVAIPVFDLEGLKLPDQNGGNGNG